LDQIRDAAIFSSRLEPQTRKTLVRTTNYVKRRALRYEEAPEWQPALLNDLSSKSEKLGGASAELDEETGKDVLQILRTYVPKEDLPDEAE
jgi:hypothetical protein